MKILVTGGTGLLGSYLTSYLTKKGYSVFSQGRSAQKKSDICCDLTQYDDFYLKMGKLRPDFIINLVALTNVDECERNQSLAYSLNVKTVENLSRWISAISPSTKLIHISTDHIYDSSSPSSESNLVLRNLYAWSKLCGEFLVERVDGVTLRTNFFGKSLTSSRVSFTDWIFSILTDKSEANLFSNVYFSPLSMATLSSKIELVINHFRKGVYNLGSRDGMSKAEFAIHFAKQLNLSFAHLKVIEFGGGTLVANRPKDMRMDVSLFENTFNCKLPNLIDEINLVAKDYEIPIRNQT